MCYYINILIEDYRKCSFQKKLIKSKKWLIKNDWVLLKIKYSKFANITTSLIRGIKNRNHFEKIIQRCQTPCLPSIPQERAPDWFIFEIKNYHVKKCQRIFRFIISSPISTLPLVNCFWNTLYVKSYFFDFSLNANVRSGA